MKNNKMRKKVIVAMSGGVDSSVAAALLKKQGYFVIGVMLKFWSPSSRHSEESEAMSDDEESPKKTSEIFRYAQNDKFNRENTCCDTDGLLAARAVARKLDIPFYMIDASEEFKREVVDYYIREYENGRTPNPCVMCNRFIKFGKLLEIAKSLGADYLATGHYARIKQNFQFSIFNFQTISNNQNSKSKTKKIYQLLKAKDKTKDQSYFLWQLRQEQLKHILFPIGDYAKEEVRKMAREFKLPTAERKDSQAVCFIPDRDNIGFLNRWAKKLQTPGPILDPRGNKIGEHEGLCYYTIGQRRRLGGEIKNQESRIKNALYVTKLDIENNALIIGEEKNLYGKELLAEDINWISSITSYPPATPCLHGGRGGLPVSGPLNCKAKIRYGGHEEEKCKVQKLKIKMTNQNAKKIKVIFNKPQRAITPGQSVVFYKGDEVLGGGIISKNY